MKKTLIAPLVGALFFAVTECYAQNNSISVTGTYSTTAYSSYTTHVLRALFEGAEISYGINTTNDHSPWIDVLGVQRINIIGSYVNMQNSSLEGVLNSTGLLGNTYGAAVSIDILLLRSGGIDVLFSPRMGLVYTTRTYQNDNNNLIVASPINFNPQVAMKIEALIIRGFRMSVAFSFSHISDGGSILPNNAINSLNMAVTFTKDIDILGRKRIKSVADYDGRSSAEFNFLFGLNGPTLTGIFFDQNRKEYLADSTLKGKLSNLYHAGFYGGFSYRASSVLTLKIGTDVVYNFQTFSYDKFFETYSGRGTSYSRIRMGIGPGIDINLGHLAVGGSYNYYIVNQLLYPANTYWTIGVKYHASRHVYLNVKSFWQGSSPDFLSFGIGFMTGKSY
jgi:hypothetical protein